jgi:GPH family glycoside/pentoside/hexuronide:cation symporter
MSDTELERTETSKGKRIIFGFPRLGTSLVLGTELFALFTLYYLGYGLDSISIGFALAMGSLSIAAGQFLLGWLSDIKYTKLGRRKPYLVIFGPLLGISFIFLLLPALVLPDMTDKNILFIWLLIWDVIFRFSYAVTTPYQAWMAEVFPTSERPKVSQVQNTFNFIGNGLMGIITLLVFTGVFEKVAANPNVIPPEFLLIVVAFGLIASILFVLIVLIMPTEPNYKMESSLWENLKTTVKNKNFMKIVLMQGISGFGWSITVTVMLTYTEAVLSLGGTDYIIVAVILLLSTFVFLYLWRKQIERIGKKKTLLLVFLIAVVFLPITLLGLVEAIPNLILGVFFMTGIGIIFGGWYLFPYIMYADIAEDDEKSTGELKAGIYSGFPNMILNIFQGISVFLLGLMLELPDVSVGTGDPFSLG